MSLTRYRARLHSGVDATVLRIDAEESDILPLFERPSHTSVAKLTARLAQARGIVGRNADAVHLAELHLLRLEAASLGLDEMLVNGGYFLFNLDEIGPDDRFGDPIGLVVADGRVFSPPLFGRAALVRDLTGWSVRHYDSRDCTVTFPSGAAAETFFADVDQFTPPPSDQSIDVVIRGRRVIGIHRAGVRRVPVWGCVARMPQDGAPEPGSDVRYVLKTPIEAGLQAGPVLIANGAPVPQTEDIFLRERLDGLTPPWGWHANWHETRAARLAAGINEHGQLFFCAIEGNSAILPGNTAKGATLADLTALMLEQGAREAINLDGGGSVQVFDAGGGNFLKSGEFFRDALFEGGNYERSLPTALKLRLRQKNHTRALETTMGAENDGP